MVFLLLAALTFLRPPAVRGLEVTILDTGQGDGICIRTKSEVILVDGGSTDQKELGRYRLEPFLKSMGIRQVDLAIVTHGDWDHISGISWLMEQKAAEKARGASDAVLIRKLAMPEIGKGEDVYGRLEQLCVQQGERCCGSRGAMKKAGMPGFILHACTRSLLPGEANRHPVRTAMSILWYSVWITECFICS